MRWQLAPAQHDEDDYQLRLVRADDLPVGELFFGVPGVPQLYVTPDAIFPGPPVVPMLAPAAEHRIPAAALESREGVELLRRLGMELPPRLRDRVQTRPLRVRIAAELQMRNVAGHYEDCLFTITASPNDGGVSETWTPAGSQAPVRHPAQQPKPDAPLVFHDRARLALVPPLMASLNVSGEPWHGICRKRVTKKFPEEFAAWLKTVPPDIELKLSGELTSLTEDAIAGSVQLEATEAGMDWFDLRVILNVADTQLTPAEIKLLLSAKGGYVRLEKKGWAGWSSSSPTRRMNSSPASALRRARSPDEKSRRISHAFGSACRGGGGVLISDGLRSVPGARGGSHSF